MRENSHLQAYKFKDGQLLDIGNPKKARSVLLLGCPAGCSLSRQMATP